MSELINKLITERDELQEKQESIGMRDMQQRTINAVREQFPEAYAAMEAAADKGEFGATFKKPANHDDFVRLALALTAQGYDVKHVGDMMGVEWSGIKQ